MKSLRLYYVAYLVMLGLAAFNSSACQKKTSGENAQANQAAQSVVVAAPGRVEPASEEIKVGAEISGKLKEVQVEEGDLVTSGQTLAVLENSDYQAQLQSAETQRSAAQAQLQSAEARLEQARAELQRVVKGARTEERLEARAGVEQADAVLRNAQIELQRRRELLRDGDISREEVDRAERDVRVAEARSKELRERFAFINAAARTEDVARAEATVRLTEAQIKEAQARISESEARIREAQARLDKTFIRSPISGVVLRKHLKSGESVDASSGMPIVTVADVATLRVRADVDEADVGKIQVGQQAYVMAKAYGDQKFWGRVVRIGQSVGKKNFRTDEPSERADTKILETLVELDPGSKLPPGLRVDTFIIISGTTPQTNAPAPTVSPT